MVFCDIASFYARKGGGVATYHNRKLDYFSRNRNHRYVMIVPAERNGIERLPGGTVFRVRGFRFDANYRHLVSVPALRRILRIVRPDVVEFGSPYLDYWAGVAAAAGLGTLQTAYYHCDFPDTYVRPFLERRSPAAAGPVLGLLSRYVRLVYGRLDATFAASRYVFDKLGSLGLTNLDYLPLGVDGDTFRPGRRDEAWRARLGVEDGDKILLFVGRYRADKGVDLLLEALPELLEDPRLHVVFSGAGPLEGRVRAWASRRKNVHDLGFVADRITMAAAYASSDGFLSPGHRETFGFGIGEALASGIPVLSADGGAGAEWVTRFGCGLVFPAGRPRALARAAGDLVRSDFGERLAAARRHLERHHAWDRVIGTWIERHENLKKSKEKGRSRRP